MPFNQYNQMLVLVSQPHELWLPLLTKAMLKITHLRYDHLERNQQIQLMFVLLWTSYNKDGNSECELIDSNLVHMLTGWLAESIPIRFVSIKDGIFAMD